MSALRNRINALSRKHTRTHKLLHAHTVTYYSFMSIFLLFSAVQWTYIPDRRLSQTDPETGSNSSLRFYSRLYLSAQFSPTSPPSLCHSTSRDAYFSWDSLPDRGRGAALLLLCCAQITEERVLREEKSAH